MYVCVVILLSSTHGLSFGTPIASIRGEAVPNSRRATGGQTPGPRGHYGGPGEIPTFLKRRVRPILKVSGEPPESVKAIVVFDQSGFGRAASMRSPCCWGLRSFTACIPVSRNLECMAIDAGTMLGLLRAFGPSESTGLTYDGEFLLLVPELTG